MNDSGRILETQRRKTLRTTLLSFLLSAAIFTSAFAGTTGKIAGTVKDKKTGEPLIGANIRLEGTSYGAATNVDGNYFIINLPPGIYTVVASMVGYTTERIENVRVSIDLTTTIDVALSETVLQLNQEVTVIAQRPLVQKDLTASTAVVSTQELSTLPISEFNDVLQLQAGYVAGSLRGGRSGEVAYWIDGIPVTDAYDGSQVVELNKNSVEELQLVSGTYNAEYGQAMSGIVNIATKEGGSHYAGSARVYGGDYLSTHTNIFRGINSFNPTKIHNFEGNLSGPVPFAGDDLTFLATGRYIYFGGWLNGVRKFNPQNIAYTDSAGTFHLYRDPSGVGDGAIVPMNWSRRNYGQGKLTWKVTPLIKATYDIIYDHTTGKSYNQAYQENPDGYGNNYTTSLTQILQVTHTLSNSTFYTVGASFFKKDFQYYLYKDPHDPNYVHPNLLLTQDVYSFLTGGTDLNRFSRSTDTKLIKVDLTSQVDNSNLVKGGVEYRQNLLTMDSYTLQPVLTQTDINLATSGPYIQTVIPDYSSLYHDTYWDSRNATDWANGKFGGHQPIQFSAYIQDKMEFKDLIVNIGVRYDYFDPDGFVLADESDPNIFNPIKPSNRFFDYNGNGIQDPGEGDKTVADRLTYWYKRASVKQQISPRFGASFPITAQGVVHFSYGYFFQIPNFELLYQNPFFKFSSGTGNLGIIGNADLKPEETIKGELGIQQQISDDISMDLTVYISDVRNLTSTRGAEIVVFGGAASYSKFINNDFGYVKGVTLSITKRFMGGLGGTLDYTYQVARGTASDPSQARNAVAGGALPEVQLTPLNWDQRHTLNATLSYDAKDFGLSFIGKYGSGTPYTPRASTDITTLLNNSQLKPSTFDLDARASYTLSMNPLRYVFYIKVYNVFDTPNQLGVFDDTGQAGFTLDELHALQTDPTQRNPGRQVNTIQQFFTIPTFYSEPRRIEIGANVEF